MYITPPCGGVFCRHLATFRGLYFGREGDIIIYERSIGGIVMEEIVKGIPYVNRGSCGRLLLSEICYIDCDYRKSTVHTDTGVMSTYISSKDISMYLDERFYQLVNTLIINFDKVKSIKRRELTFLNGESLLISRNCYLKLRKDFIVYLKNLQKTLANS